LRGSPILANLGNDPGFISKEYISIGTRPLGETQSKAMRTYVRSGQYHTRFLKCCSLNMRGRVEDLVFT